MIFENEINRNDLKKFYLKKCVSEIQANFYLNKFLKIIFKVKKN